MDLEKVKKVWQERKIEIDSDEDEIKSILTKKGQNAFEELFKIERSRLIWIPLLIIPLFFFDKTFVYFFLLYFIPSSAWNVNRYLILKEINISEMDIISVYDKVTKCKKNIVIEQIVGSIWATAYFTWFYFHALRNNTSVPKYVNNIFIIVLAIIYIILMLSVIYSYRYYYRNTKIIEEELKDLKKEH